MGHICGGKLCLLCPNLRLFVILCLKFKPKISGIIRVLQTMKLWFNLHFPKVISNLTCTIDVML